jgi:serine-type D-Ala-D-Ala carboxypeptidase (penicillin-binding protein 5/6)
MKMTVVAPSKLIRLLAVLAVMAAVAATLVGSGPAFSQKQINPVSGAKDKKDEPSPTTAPYAILMEAESGAVLFEKSADQLVAPASLAKLMTTEVVFNEIKEGNIKLDEEFVVSANAWRKGGAPSGGSTMFAAIHSRIKVEDLLQGVIIQSGNDACIVLAEGIAGNEAGFSRMMNARARELGLTKSNFTNSAGLPDPDMRVTVRELGKLAQHIITTYPDLYRWYGEREFTWNKIRQQNRNPLLTMNIGADGLKTGYTSEAGYGLVGSAVNNGLRLIVVVNGMKSANERADDAKKLLNWGFNGFESKVLFAESQMIAEARLYGGEKARVKLRSVGGKQVRIMIPRNTNERIVARLVYSGPVQAPVEEGQKIGMVRVLRGDNVVLETPLEAAEAVEAGSMTRRAFDAAYELFGDVFRAGLKRLDSETRRTPKGSS